MDMTRRQRLGIKLWAWFAAWKIRLWWVFTQVVTRPRHADVPKFTEILQIPEALSWGKRYKSDPWRGESDVMYHPHRLYTRMSSGARIGDCDDHAIVWAHALVSNELCNKDEVYLGTVRFRDLDTGVISGHAVIVFQDRFAPLTYWADYHEPVPYTGKWGWAQDVAAAYHAEFLGATMTPIRGINKRGRVLFGRTHVKLADGV